MAEFLFLAAKVLGMMCVSIIVITLAIAFIGLAVWLLDIIFSKIPWPLDDDDDYFYVYVDDEDDLEELLNQLDDEFDDEDGEE
jgi:ABC-type Na+ efflux pump permease subunit